MFRHGWRQAPWKPYYVGGLPTSPTPLLVHIIILCKLEAKASFATYILCWGSCSVHNLFNCSGVTCRLVQTAHGTKGSLINQPANAISPSDRGLLKSLETVQGWCWNGCCFLGLVCFCRKTEDSDPHWTLLPISQFKWLFLICSLRTFWSPVV